MPFMELETTAKGATYVCECIKCGALLYTHEWAYDNHNQRRDAMVSGTLCCDHCVVGRCAPGYFDCTEWNFGTNRRVLERVVRGE